MSNKLVYLLLFVLFCQLGWRTLLPSQRKELHRISKISAVCLITASALALLWHYWR